jgi:transcription termination/antitermination protein NusG
MSLEEQQNEAPDGSEIVLTAEEEAERKKALIEAIRNPANPRMKWFVLQTFSGQENRAKTTLLEYARKDGLEGSFGEIIIPTLASESVSKTGKKKVVKKTQYPGYFYVQMEANDQTLQVVRKTPRISGFIGGTQIKPKELAYEEVLKHALSELGEVSETSTKSLEILFERGESVKVIDGPFANFDGLVDEVSPEKARLRVLVSIFGRETPVDLEYKQVEKV